MRTRQRCTFGDHKSEGTPGFEPGTIRTAAECSTTRDRSLAVARDRSLAVPGIASLSPARRRSVDAQSTPKAKVRQRDATKAGWLWLRPAPRVLALLASCFLPPRTPPWVVCWRMDPRAARWPSAPPTHPRCDLWLVKQSRGGGLLRMAGCAHRWRAHTYCAHTPAVHFWGSQKRGHARVRTRDHSDCGRMLYH